MLESTWFQTSVISGKKREFSKCFSFQFEVDLKLNFHSSPILVESGARITATAAQSDLKCVIYKVWNLLKKIIILKNNIYRVGGGR